MSTALHCPVLFSFVLCCTLLSCTALYCTFVLCYTVLCIALYSAVLHFTALYIAQYCIRSILRGTALFRRDVRQQTLSYSRLGFTMRHLQIDKCNLSLVTPLMNYIPTSSHTSVLQSLYHFLAMVEDGRLEFKSASPTQLCLVAVGYHNLAVIQIKMQASDLACKTSQNARKIARLCLSASTRYLTAFQRTHEAALADLKYHMEYRYTETRKNYLQPCLPPT